MNYFDIDLSLGGMTVNIFGTYTPARPAPRIDPRNYDGTKCDPGEDEHLEILRVKTTSGHAIDFNEEDFIDNWHDVIVDALEE